MKMGRVKAPREIQVETLLIKDKINRYRGILKLHAHDKKLQLSQATKLKSAISKKVASLEVDVKKYRKIVNDLKNENKRAILRALGDHREFYLAFSYLKPSEICAAVYEDCDVKRRLLDRLYCEKKRKLKQGIDLQMEHVVLSSEFEEQSEEELHCEQQQLIIRLQESITKHNAARTIHFTYLSMLNILKKDALFFDNLMDIVKEDQTAQCKQMLRVTVMGQLAAENLDDIRQKYKRMTRVVLHNMKIREQMLSVVRCEVEDLWAYAQSLVRVESNHIFKKKGYDEASVDRILESHLADLETICNKVKEILFVRSYYDLFSRFETQSVYKTVLLTRLDTNLKNRDLLLDKKNHALQVLENLIHSIKITEQYKANEHDILEQLEIEKKRETDLKEQKKALGDLLTDIRAALLNMSTMLLCLKDDRAVAKKPIKDANKAVLKEIQLRTTTGNKEDTKKSDVLSEIEGESDVLLLLSKISWKIGILFNMSNFELEQEKEEKARNLYQTYVSHYTSNLIYGTGEEEPIGLLVEHEAVDITVPTRADIKLRSRQIIEAQLKSE